MASSIGLGAIYLEDRDSSQGIKNPITVQSTQARRKEKQKKQATLAISQGLRNFVALQKLFALRKFATVD